MATVDNLARQAYKLVAPTLDSTAAEMVYSAIAAGEPYEALIALVSEAVDEGITLPSGLVEETFALVNNQEDRDGLLDLYPKLGTVNR